MSLMKDKVIGTSVGARFGQISRFSFCFLPFSNIRLRKVSGDGAIVHSERIISRSRLSAGILARPP